MINNKILYILGAGASVGQDLQGLPLSKGIIKDKIVIQGLAIRLEMFSDKLSSTKTNDKDIDNAISHYQKSIKHFAEKGYEFGDIDTYAKYLYIKSNNHKESIEFKAFIDLKKSLSLYFLYAQIIEKRIDIRYRNFLIRVLEGLTFPDKIKILNWNYDYQMQLAALNFKKEVVSDEFHTPPILDYLPYSKFKDSKIKPDINGYDMIQLNGIAGIDYNKAMEGKNLFLEFEINNLSELFRAFIKSEGNGTMLSFAWETFSKPKIFSENDKWLEKLVKGVRILVIIGYSFPFYNRKKDTQILNLINSNGSGGLQKIYYQDPNHKMGETLRIKFPFLNQNIEIIPITDLDEFYVPHEF